jgi:hypothetical protein
VTVEVSGNGILLKLKGAAVSETWGSAKLGKVEIEQLEEAAGREA